MTQTTVEVLPNGAIKVHGVDEYECSAVVRQVLEHRVTVNRQNQYAMIASVVGPWLCVAPVFLVLWTLCLAMLRPMPPVQQTHQGAYQSYVQ